MLPLFDLQSLKLKSVINICLLYVISIYTCWYLYYAIVILSTTNTSFYYDLLLIITKLCLYHKSRINLFVIFCNTIICCNQVHLWPPKSVDLRQKANIEIKGSIRGRPIFVREIMTLILSAWLHKSWSIQYCNQPVLAIALDLNVTYSVLRSLISFREAPWYRLVYYVWAITTTWQG